MFSARLVVSPFRKRTHVFHTWPLSKAGFELFITRSDQVGPLIASDSEHGGCFWKPRRARRPPGQPKTVKKGRCMASYGRECFLWRHFGHKITSFPQVSPLNKRRHLGGAAGKNVCWTFIRKFGPAGQRSGTGVPEERTFHSTNFAAITKLSTQIAKN